ncbi:MAG: type III toxin-antitoxin system ToxN/AbiQ family toxin [Fusobacteriaceae bacterium]
MKWCTIDKKFEPKIPDIDYGEKKLKPFFTPLFKVGDLIYVSQVTSPKPRHSQIKEDLDFVKLFKGTKIIGVVNLNYMFPVPESLIIEIEYSFLENFKEFQTEKEKNDYIVLLKKEMKEIKNRNIDKKAEELYSLRYTFPDNRVSKRCLDYKFLENRCLEYNMKNEEV